MKQVFDKIIFLLELFLNGSFIFLYALKVTGRIPETWNAELIGQGIAVGTVVIPTVLFIQLIHNYLHSSDLQDFFRKHIFSIVVFVPIFIMWRDEAFIYWPATVHLALTIFLLYDDPSPIITKKQFTRQFLDPIGRLMLKPAQLVMISFSTVILIGTILLMLPLSKVDGNSMNIVDALFLSTSATCVTGLTTLSLSQLNLFGQIVILVLIQIGGISIMTLYTSMTLLLGKTMGIKGSIIMQDFLDISGLEDLVVMIVKIIKYTIVIEFFGAVVLTLAFFQEGHPWAQAVYYGIFHSISAFCNAGFSPFDDSLESYGTSPFIHGTIAILVTLGGLGFIVLKDLEEVIFKRKKLVRLGVHTKVVLTTSVILTLSGACLFFFGEFLNGLDGLSLWGKIQVSLFQSVTLRTAGFNTIPLDSLNLSTIYMMSLFMFIGGSPGSTAGGVKTTTLAILIESIRSTLKGKKNVEIFDRTISSPIVVRTTALTFISIIITSFFIFILMKIEPETNFLVLFFETVSASATVGLSLGLTPDLSVMGKFAILSLMYIGRIGPLTLLLAIGQEDRQKGKFDYPKGRIMIG